MSLTLAGIQLYLQNAFFSDVIATDTAFLGELQNYENQENNPFKDTNLEDFNNYQNLFYIISVPISAIATWAAFFIAGKRGFNFTEHIVLNLYYSAQIIIINSVITIALLSFGINYLLISGYSTVLIFAYFFYVLKRSFYMKFAEAIGMYILVMIFYIIMFALAMVLAVIIGVILVILFKT